MRYRIRGNMMHRTLFLSLCWWLVFDSTFLTGEARGPRRRLTTTEATTLATSTTTTIKPVVLGIVGGTNKVRRRTRILQKRTGASQEITGDYEDQLDRQPLYDAPNTGFDDQQYEPPAHYYSPSKTQKQRKRKLRAQFNQGQDRRINYDGPSGSSQYSSTPKYSSPHKYPGPPPPQYSSGPPPPSYPSGPSHPEHFEEEFQQEQPAPKNYAFAYAVRDDNNAEDFSHKEARDGKLTMGEYRINLPDGRIQVVRYTAGGKLGYKADVTYEEDDPRNKQLTKPVRPPKNTSPKPGLPYYSSPTSAVHKKYAPSPGPSHYDTPDPTKNYEDIPIFVSRPLKSHRPSLSPSSAYSGYSSLGGSRDYPDTGSGSPSQTFDYKAGPLRTRVSPPTLPSYYKEGLSSSTGRPKSIYDKMPPRKKKPKYSENLSLLHEQSPRAGPERSKNFEFNQQIETSSSREHSYPTQQPQSSYDGPLKYYSSGPTIRTTTSPRQDAGYPNTGYNNFRSKPSKSPKPRPSKPSYFQDNQVGPSPFVQIKINPTQSGKGALIPIEHFKAGPSKKRLRKKNKQRLYSSQQDDHSYPEQSDHPSIPSSQNYDYRNRNQNESPNYPSPNNQQNNYQTSFNPPSSVAYQEPYHYYNSQHASYHHGGYVEPTQPPQNSGGYSRNQINPTGSSYSIDYPGGKHSFYLKTSSGKPKSGRLDGRKTTSSGLVYLETPGEGPRPSDVGVKETLSRLPNMPPSRSPSVHSSAIHNYEVGSKDYGNSVGYKNSGRDESRDGPYEGHSRGYKGEYSPHLNTNHFDTDHNDDHHHDDNDHQSFHREYLIDSRKDTIVPMESSSVEGVESATEAAFQFDVKK